MESRAQKRLRQPIARGSYGAVYRVGALAVKDMPVAPGRTLPDARELALLAALCATSHEQLTLAIQRHWDSPKPQPSPPPPCYVPRTTFGVARSHADDTRQVAREFRMLLLLHRLFPPFLRPRQCLLDDAHSRVLLTTDMIEGAPLSDLLADETPLRPAGLAARVTEELARQVARMHFVGVTHRDLKPANVLVRSAPARDETAVVLVDFGLARADELMRTRIGTPYYMAPEMFRDDGDAGGYTRAVDLWALGVLLLQIHTGLLLFAHKRWTTLVDVRRTMCSLTDQQVTARLESVAASLPPRTRSLLAQLLTVDPTKRQIKFQKP